MAGRAGLYLDSSETFENYEKRRSPIPPQQFSQQKQQYYPQQSQRAHDYGGNGNIVCSSHFEPSTGEIVHVMRERPSERKALPVWLIIYLAISVPIIIIVCIFGAAQLQELGVM